MKHPLAGYATMPVIARRQAAVRWAVLVAITAPAVVQAQPLDMKAVELLQQMAAAGSSFDAAPLRAAGLPGLVAVLDRLLPDSADPQGEGEVHRTVARLVARLGDDNYRVRQAASEELSQMGPAIRPLLLGAVGSDDAEIGWRARRILRHWDDTGHRDDKQLMEAFAVYLREVDDPACLEEIGRRTAAALGGPAPTEPQWKLLGLCLTAIGRSGNDRIVNRLEPLLAHEDVRVAVAAVDRVADGAGPAFFPELLLAALAGDRPEVVVAAVKAAALCSHAGRRDEVRRRLVELFDRGDDTLRPLCALPLARDFGHQPAEDYLLAELLSGDPSRRDPTLKWLGDPANLGRPASEKLIAAFAPLLEAKDYGLRRKACAALAIYGGENVVLALIPLLGDANASFADEVAYRLDHQRDKPMLRRLLLDAAENHADEKVRAKAAATLKMLDGRAEKAEE